MDAIGGTRWSRKGMQLMTSSGIPTIDYYLGGGLPINSITLLEEDEHRQYSSMLVKSFVAEGIDCDHRLLIVSPAITSTNSKLVKELPTRCALKSDTNKSVDMKIAWRYESMPMQTTAEMCATSSHFDFGAHISQEKLNSADFQFLNHNSFLEYLKSERLADKKVTRILFDGLFSPLSSLDMNTIPKFIFELKILVRKLSNVVCLVTCSPQIALSSELSYVRSRVHNIVDCVLGLVVFDELSPNPYTEYNGLFNIMKIPKLNSLNYYFIPETFDLGFQLKKNSRFFAVDKLCLPPDLSENVSRTTSCSTINKSFDF